MNATQAKTLTKAAGKSKEKARQDKVWAEVVRQITNRCNNAQSTLDYPKKDMTPELRKRLKKNGYKVNDCHPPQDPEDMHYTQISWE
jgi:hypothetical protein